MEKPRPAAKPAPPPPAGAKPEPKPASSRPPAPAPVPATTELAPEPPPNVSAIGLPWLTPPPTVRPQLTARGYVFPVYGQVRYGDSFGAPRPDVSGGWRHGDDIFAPLGPRYSPSRTAWSSRRAEPDRGQPPLGRDEQGNEFYYAHLSAYTPLAKNGNAVRAGDVLGFVGNTGDAEGGPYHLHFEIHPTSLLFLGYDGVIDPTSYLDAWRRLQDVSFPAGGAWASSLARKRTPTPGVILLAEQRHLHGQRTRARLARARAGPSLASDGAPCASRRAPAHAEPGFLDRGIRVVRNVRVREVVPTVVGEPIFHPAPRLRARVTG